MGLKSRGRSGQIFGAYICAAVLSTRGRQIADPLGAEGKRLLDVRRRHLAHRIGHRTVAEPVIAAADLGRRPLHLHLLFDRQREKIDRALPRCFDLLLRDAVADDQEKAGVRAGGIDLPRHRALGGCIAAAQRRYVDGGYRVLRSHGKPFR